MRPTLLALALVALTLAACGRPNQALPEQEKENYEKLISEGPKKSEDSGY